MKESQFQKEIMNDIRERFPGSIVYKNFPSIQGFPDLTIVYKSKYAILECKNSERASHQPNQDYYIDKINSIGGFASFIFPENKEEVLNAMERSFKRRT